MSIDKIQEMVTITKEEYEELIRKSHELYCLECTGVDNWEGYSIAMDMYLADEESGNI